MYALFPGLLDLSVLVPTFLRVVAGGFFLGIALGTVQQGLGVRSVRHHLVGALMGTIGLLLVVGLFTQGAALAGLWLCGEKAVRSSTEEPVARSTYGLLAALCFALLFLGAGPFAFDLPL